jgi:acetoacetate decarboxylase
MDRNDVLRLLSTPVNAPAAAGPYRFTNRGLHIRYHTDPTALRRVVPGPLQIREPLVRFTGPGGAADTTA